MSNHLPYPDSFLYIVISVNNVPCFISSFLSLAVGEGHPVSAAFETDKRRQSAGCSETGSGPGGIH